MKVKNLILILAIFISNHVLAQEKYIKKGDKFFAQQLYPEAIKNYKESLGKIKDSRLPHVNLQLARSYKEIFDYRNAAEWYEKARNPEDTTISIEYGHVLMSLGRYDDAMTQFTAYCNKSGKSNCIEKYKRITEWPNSQGSKKISSFNIHPAELSIGGRAYGMTYFNDGIIFSAPQQTTDQNQTVYYDLAFASVADSVSFGNVQPFSKEINRAYYEASPSITQDGTVLYFTSNNTEEEKYKPSKKNKTPLVNSHGKNVLQLYYSTKEGNEWSKPVKISFNEIEFNYTFPHISADGNTLYFASDKQGGYGKLDIYKTIKTGENTWSVPENLGPEVNTDEDEVFPFIHGENFYFSSRGHEGFGGLDIYSATINGGTIGNVENMGQPVNSSADDFSLILKEDGKSGYMASNRNNFSEDEIFSVIKRSLTDTLRGIVTGDSLSNPLSGVTVNLYSTAEADSGKLVGTMVTGADGKWQFVVNPEKEYKVEFVMTGYDTMGVAVVTENGAGGKKFKDVNANLSRTKMTESELAQKLAGSTNTDVSFRVQIGAYRYPENFSYNKLEKLGKVEINKLEDTITRFTIGGIFKSFEEARELCQKVVQNGVSDAFVYAMYKGERASLKDLIRDGLLPKS